MLFVFFIITVMADSVFKERTNGAIRRLRAAPVGKGAIVLGKLVPFYFINLVQVASMFAVARLAFGMDLMNVPALVVLTLCLSLAATGMGIMITSLAKTLTQAASLGAILSLTLGALGGAMVPAFIMPDWMQAVGRVAPQAWAIRAYQDVLVRGRGVTEILLEAGVLLAFAAVFTTVGAWRFRFS